MSLEFDFDELKEALKKMEESVATEIAEQALRAGAEPVLEAQKELIPVDTGELRSSAKVSEFTSKKGRNTIHIGFPKASGRRNIEVGWLHNRGFKGVPGKFFMEESLEVAREEAIERMKEKIKSGLGR